MCTKPLRWRIQNRMYIQERIAIMHLSRVTILLSEIIFQRSPEYENRLKRFVNVTNSITVITIRYM